MQKIEKLAKTVLENAEQGPPKEVWEGIESKLHTAATPKSGHRWLWTIGAGFVVASALVFGLSGVKMPETPTTLAMADSGVKEQRSEVLPTIADITLVEDSVGEVPVVATNEAAERKFFVSVKSQQKRDDVLQTTTAKQTPAVVENRDEDDEPVFDLLEYQLNSHEFDIPSETRTVQRSAQDRNESELTSATNKEKRNEARKEETVEINISIPNIVTPNGDGYNDCWVIPDLDKYGKASVQIYTAQRKRVYAADNYMGDFCGDDLPSGDYFYILTIRDKKYTRRGVLVIKR